MELTKLTVVKPAPTPGDTSGLSATGSECSFTGDYMRCGPSRMGKEPRAHIKQQYEKYFRHFDPDLYDPGSCGRRRRQTRA